MDMHQAKLLREVLDGTGWTDRFAGFGRALRTTRTPGGLLLVGPPEDEPWHLTAHLDDESRYGQIPELSPTLVRWNPPPDAPKHLSIGLDRLGETRRGESLLVVSDLPSVPLLERVDDVRRKGANVFCLDTGDRELEGLAHEVLTVPETDPLVSFDSAQHLVSLAAGEVDPERFSARESPRGFRARLGRLLDALSGPS